MEVVRSLEDDVVILKGVIAEMAMDTGQDGLSASPVSPFGWEPCHVSGGALFFTIEELTAY